MNKDAATGTVAVIGAAGTLALLLPAYDKAWEAIPGQSPKFNAHLRIGEMSFGALAISVGILESLASGSPLPFFVALALTGFFVGAYELAYKAVPTTTKIEDAT